MAAHPLRGPARWLVLPAISAAGGALAFGGGKGPEGWDWPMGLAVGLAPAVGVALTARVWLSGVLALAAGVLGRVAVQARPEAFENLLQPSVENLLLAALTVVPALLNAYRVTEGPSWGWVNGLLQLVAGALVLPALWWMNVLEDTMSVAPFLILPAGHIAAAEIAGHLCPHD